MKIINLTLLFLLVSLSLFAQEDYEIEPSSEVEISKSESYDVVDAVSKMYYTIDENNLLAVKIQGRGRNHFVFQVFTGPTMELKSTTSELINEKGFQFEYIVQMKKKLYFFYSIYDRASKTEELFVRSIDTREGGFDSEAKLLVSVSRKISFSYDLRTQKYEKFRIDVSSTEETFAIKYNYSPEKNSAGSSDVIGMHVFKSESLDKIWNNDFEMPYIAKMMDNLDFAVDSEGYGYFLIKKYKEEQTRKNREDSENQSLAILIASENGGLNEVEFSLEDKLINSVILKENSKGDIICSGYYRKPKSYGIDGAFISILDNNGSLSDPQFYEFSMDFIRKYQRLSEKGKQKLEKAEEKDDLALGNLYMRDVEVLADGGIVLAGEIFYITSYTDSRGNTHTTLHFEDVILVKINADGSLGWMRKLFKRSTSESFRLMTSENYTYILYVDALRNATMTDDGITDNDVKGVCVTAHRIDNESGAMKYLYLFDTRKIDGINVYQYALNRITALTDKSFAIELYIKDKKDMMFKVEFEE